MAIQGWSDEITVAELSDGPQFSDDIAALLDQLDENPTAVVLNFAGVSSFSSSDIAHLLRLRKTMLAKDCQLVLCGVNTQVWGVLLVTGLDKIFEFTNDISTALATIQLSGQNDKA